MSEKDESALRGAEAGLIVFSSLAELWMNSEFTLGHIFCWTIF